MLAWRRADDSRGSLARMSHGASLRRVGSQGVRTPNSDSVRRPGNRPAGARPELEARTRRRRRYHRVGAGDSEPLSASAWPEAPLPGLRGGGFNSKLGL